MSYLNFFQTALGVNNMSIAYLNGEWNPMSETKVSVLDRGFMFGDGVYEVVPVYQKKAFTLKEHLARLGRSLDEIKIANPLDDAGWTNLIEAAIERSDEYDAVVYIQVTRGASESREHVWPENTPATVLVMVYDAPLLSRKEVPPYKMITLEDFRWQKGHIKSVSLIAAGLFKNEAVSRGADDSILIRNGFVTEASSSNVYIVKDGVLITPPASNSILHGITRHLVLSLARGDGMSVEEREISVSELDDADEVLISSAGHEVWPVGSVNSNPVGNGEGGVVWQRLDQLFQGYKAKTR
jgi:D-alanine transaminase